jgi:hypothetical protein
VRKSVFSKYIEFELKKARSLISSIQRHSEFLNTQEDRLYSKKFSISKDLKEKFFVNINSEMKELMKVLQAYKLN